VKNVILLMLAAFAAHASSITLFSGVSAGESNDFGANVLVTPEPSWALDPQAKWVSFENTGFGGIVLPNTDLGTPTAIFYQDFTLTGGTGVAGSIQVWADDTAVVKLDGVVLFAANPALETHCAAGPIGCTPSNVGNLTFSAPGLTHTLEFDVFQRGADTFGLMYNAQVNSTVIPEPATMSIAVIGLVIFGCLFKSSIKN
jgi:hypothetical protein